MAPVITPEEAYAVCEDIADSRAGATARNAYGDGYRAAAEHIAAAIRARRSGGCVASGLERDLHDAEIEARTFARVIDAAVAAVESAGTQTDAADAVRALVSGLFTDDDLPPILRKRERSSGTHLSDPPRAIESRPPRVAGAAAAIRGYARLTPLR